MRWFAFYYILFENVIRMIWFMSLLLLLLLFDFMEIQKQMRKICQTMHDWMLRQKNLSVQILHKIEQF